jgi:pimeloyl-ACP methyl ester carboxylesterase
MTGSPPPTPYPAPIEATSASLPPAVAAAIAAAPTGESGTTEAGGIPFAWEAWGEPTAPPILLVHGVTSSGRTFWRLGPALAAAGRRVLAVDLPGHGRTGQWTGRYRFRATAADVAAFARAAGLDRARLAVLGHSWGAMVAAALPTAGLRPERLILLDPPVVPQAGMAAMTRDPVERHHDDLGEALRVIEAAYPSWTAGDVAAKAEGLVRVDEAGARAVLLENGDWDGGLGDLGDPAAAGVETWVVRGDPAAGSLTPDAALPSFAAVVGAARILTIAGGPHSPQRTRIEATTVAILRALGVG